MRSALALLFAALLGSPALAAPLVTFSPNGVNAVGTIQTYLVPTTGIYLLTAAGAQGADNGGRGALVSGEYSLTAGTVLSIGVGQMTVPADAQNLEIKPGGGGTFIVAPGDAPLLVAGGGAGNTGFSSANGQLVTGNFGTGGIGANGGAGGGGFFGDGTGSGITFGLSWLSGLAGGNPIGGFGGGGSASAIGGIGGGGGYTGGNGGFNATGGSSYFAAGALNTTGTAGSRTGSGFASIQFLRANDPPSTAIPEPTSLAVLGLLAFGGFVARRRQVRQD